MAPEKEKSVRLFYCYSHRDKELRKELSNHLGRKNITEWHDKEILPGDVWQDKIDYNLKIADIILLLISADFISSNYCYGVEMKTALERHESGEAIVIPVILRDVHWEDAPFNRLQILPSNCEAVTIMVPRNWTGR